MKCTLIEKISCDINCFSCSNSSGLKPKELSIKIPMSRPLPLSSVVGAGGITRAAEGVTASCPVVGSSLSVPGTLKAFY